MKSLNKLIVLTILLFALIQFQVQGVFAQGDIGSGIPFRIAVTASATGTTGFAYAEIPYNHGKITAANISLGAMPGSNTVTVCFADNYTTGSVGASTGQNYWKCSAAAESAETAIITSAAPVPLIDRTYGATVNTSNTSKKTYIKFYFAAACTAATYGYVYGIWQP